MWFNFSNKNKHVKNQEKTIKAIIKYLIFCEYHLWANESLINFFGITERLVVASLIKWLIAALTILSTNNWFWLLSWKICNKNTSTKWLHNVIIYIFCSISTILHFTEILIFYRPSFIQAKWIRDRPIISPIKPTFDDQFFVDLRVLCKLQTWNCSASSANQNKNNFTFK